MGMDYRRISHSELPDAFSDLLKLLDVSYHKQVHYANIVFRLDRCGRDGTLTNVLKVHTPRIVVANMIFNRYGQVPYSISLNFLDWGKKSYCIIYDLNEFWISKFVKDLS